MELQKKKIMNAAAMGVESSSVRKKSSRWEGSSSSSSSSSMEGVNMDEEIRKAMEVEIRRLMEEEEFEKNTINAMREGKAVVRNKIWNLMCVERAMNKMMMGVTDEDFRKEGKRIQKEIRNAIQEERCTSLSISLREKRPFVSMDEDIRNAMEEDITRREAQTNKYLMEMDPAEQIRNARCNFVLHISPLEIIDNPGDQDFINVAADNINQIELAIIVINHHTIHQYWTPRSTTTSSYLCPYHDDYLHPLDDDDEEMILATCRPLLDSCGRIEMVLDGGVFAASDDDEQHIMSTLLSRVDLLFKYGTLPTHEHLEDLKRSITRSITEAKSHVLKVKPKRVRICVQVSHVLKKYYGSKEDATFAAALDDALDSS